MHDVHLERRLHAIIADGQSEGELF